MSVSFFFFFLLVDVVEPDVDLSVDLRDALGDRLYLTGTVRRDGTVFDVGKATEFK